MKKQFFLFLILWIPLVVNAQVVDKSTIYVGANSNMNFSSNLKEEEHDNFNISVSGGYFPVNNFLLGAGISYGTVQVFNDEMHSLTYQLFGRYYFKNFFGGAGYQINNIKDYQEKSFFVLQAGYAAFLTPSIAIEPSFNYGFSMEKNFANEYALHLGFGIYLNRKKDQ